MNTYDIKKIAVTVGGTYNIGNYESVRVEITVEGHINDLEKPTSFISYKLWEEATSNLKELVKKEIEARRG